MPSGVLITHAPRARPGKPVTINLEWVGGDIGGASWTTTFSDSGAGGTFEPPTAAMGDDTSGGPNLATTQYTAADAGAVTFDFSDELANGYTDTSGPLDVSLVLTLTVSGMTADDVVYNVLNTDPTLTDVHFGSATLIGVLDGDDVTLPADFVGAFDDSVVGTGKTVTANDVVLEGADAGFYIVSPAPTALASILPGATTFSHAGTLPFTFGLSATTAKRTGRVLGGGGRVQYIDRTPSTVFGNRGTLAMEATLSARVRFTPSIHTYAVAGLLAAQVSTGAHYRYHSRAKEIQAADERAMEVLLMN